MRGIDIGPDLHARIPKRIEDLADPALASIPGGMKPCCGSSPRERHCRRQICADAVHLDAVTVPNDDQDLASRDRMLLPAADGGTVTHSSPASRPTAQQQPQQG